MFLHYLDILPFFLGTLVLVLGPLVISTKNPLRMLIVATSALYLLAQSSWFSSFLEGDAWGRDWANFVWFLFNTSTMVIFSWILFFKKH